jgi:endonuclease YncB( thermonuclease family)
LRSFTIASIMHAMPFLPLLAAATLQCTVIDGDTLRCGDERVRLIGIDAPELPGHCRSGRICAPGSGPASKAALARAMRGQRVRLQRHGFDRYGRTLAFAFVGRVNLSCAQLQAHQAIYVMRWDIRGIVGRCRRAD